MIIPYVQMNHGWTLSDEQVFAVWDQMVSDGNAKVVFYEGGAKDRHEFLSWVKSPKNLVVFVAKDNEIKGVAWLNGIADNFAFAHFCTLSNAKKGTIEIGLEVLKYWESIPGPNGPLFDVILGLIPEFNKKALYYIEKLGFKTVGSIPKIVHGKEAAQLSYYEVNNG